MIPSQLSYLNQLFSPDCSISCVSHVVCVCVVHRTETSYILSEFPLRFTEKKNSSEFPVFGVIVECSELDAELSNAYSSVDR